MAEITPRWEWRSFGWRFGEAEGRLARLTPSGVQESDEIYLLSRAGGNVKIRLTADQSAKTKTTLEFFSARLRQEGPAG